MDTKKQKTAANTPNYKLIYSDIIRRNHPEKMDRCAKLLSKEKLSVLDVIKLNGILFPNPEGDIRNNQKLKSYDENSIKELLKYQRKNNLTNVELSKEFNLSRNTIAKWKKFY